MSPLKQLALRVLTGRVPALLYAPLMRGRATILMLHRFRNPGLGVAGHDPAALRGLLGWLRRARYPLVDLAALLAGLARGEPTWDRAVAFTIDDGYEDQATVGAPAFAEFDCPVTTFVTTGFLDGRLWLWWDRIEYVFHHTRLPTITTQIGDHTVRYDRAATGYALAQAAFTTRCKMVPDAVKIAAVAALAAAAQVDLPDRPPASYAPMTWDAVRACEDRGMQFGPQTVTHPVLARTTDAQSRMEILESWRRLQAEARHAIPVFCYPNGEPEDFGPREIAELRAAGLVGAVVGTPGYADRRGLASPDGAFRVKRFGFTEDLPILRQYVTGLEALKNVVRGAA